MKNQDDSQIAKNVYSHSKVYKLQSDDGYYYWGSTTQQVCYRLSDHKVVSKKEQNRKIYSIFTHERFCKGDIKIVLVEEFKLENKEQLLREEDKYIKISIDDPFCLNSQHAVLNYEKTKEQKKQTHHDYYEKNKLMVLHKNKLYRVKNKEKINQTKKEYNEIHKETIKENKQIYYTTHKEQIQEKKKHYYIRNKECISDKNKLYRESHNEQKKIMTKTTHICTKKK